MLDLNDALTADELEALAAAEAQGSGRATKPNRIPFRDVPSFLRDINEQRFCLWKWVKGAKGKWTKPPFGAAGYTISNKKPGGWLTHDQALNVFRNGHGFHGIGMMLLDLKGYGFLDLDNCRDPNTGEVAPWAQELIDQGGSYTELTPSGTGFRIIGTVPEDFRAVHTKVPTRDDGHVEVYANCATGRYITITGQSLDGTLENIADLSALINELTPPQEKEKQPAGLDFNRTAEEFTEANLPGDLIDIIQKGAPF